MIDLHCHILPGMDDGPATTEEALAMCRAAAADGIRTIVATPHFKPGTHQWTGDDLSRAVELLNSELRSRGIPVGILPAAEVAVFPELLSVLARERFLTINNSIYFLLEFRPYAVPAAWEAFLQSFLDAGMVPIIAHPERNAWFMSHPGALMSAVRRGVMVQITAAGITGGLGPEVRAFSVRLLSHDMVHIIASDAHSPDLRPPLLADAVSLAADLIGTEKAHAMVTTTPAAVIAGRRIHLPESKGYAPTDGPNRGWLERLVRRKTCKRNS